MRYATYKITSYKIFFIIIALLFVACSSNDARVNINKSHQNTHFKKSNIVSNIAKPYLKEISENKDGAIIIDNGYSALFHRLGLIEMATKSIDIQTYIYKNDFTSKLLLHALYRAAKRGVKIRILIDDNGINNDYKELAMLNNIENISIKIFNPYYFRNKFLRLFEIPFNFNRINRRMHNKMFLFDDVALIVGGRNIGNDYFDFSEVNFTDIDILFIGAVAISARDNFNMFWNFSKSVDFNEINHKKYKSSQLKRPELSQDLLATFQNYIKEFKNLYESRKLDIAWGRALFLADEPDKIDIAPYQIDSLILDTLTFYLNKATKSIDISSAYLVPGVANVDLLHQFTNRGVKISILTNSLSSTDVVPVYSNWEKYRKMLYYANIDIYEYDDILHNPKYINSKSMKAKLRDKAKTYNSKRARVSLHSKSIVIDDYLVGVGSFNLDYRSSNLNTENMVFFESNELALMLKDLLVSQMLDSYKIKYDNGKCYWHKLENGKLQKVYKSAPNTSIWLKIYNKLANIIPEKEV